jgi:hypothetical protein
MGNASSGGLAFVTAGGGVGGGPSLTIGGNTAGVGAIVSSGTLFLAGGNNITLSQNGQSISINGGAGGAGFSAGVSTGGNAAGTTGVSGTQLVLAGGNNITLSQATGANGATVTVSGLNVATTAAYYFGGNTAGQSSSSTALDQTLSFNLSGAISGGWSNSSILLSAPATSSISGTGNASVAVNASTISIGANAAALSIGGNSTSAGAGYSNISTGTGVLLGGNNITLSQNGASITISANGAAAVSIGGNSTSAGAGYSNISAGTAVLLGGNNITLSQNGASITVSGASQSVQTQASGNIGATGFATTTIAGAVIAGTNNTAGFTLAVPAYITAQAAQNSFFNALTGDVTTLTQIGNGSVQVYPINAPKAFSASRADMMIFNSISSSSNSSHAGVISVFAALYTLNGSTLSLASSGSQSYQWTNTSNNSMGSISAQRRLSLPINVNYTGGDLWMAVMSQTSSTNANWFSASNLVIQPQLTGQLAGLIGQATNNTNQIQPGYGLWSTTSAVMPASMALTAITGAGSAALGANAYMQPVQFANLTA